MRYGYRVRREDDKSIIVTLSPNFDAHNVIRDAVAVEFECDPDELECAEEYDANGDWTGDELISLHGETVARLEYQFG